jgi:hypothetical protein
LRWSKNVCVPFSTSRISATWTGARQEFIGQTWMSRIPLSTLPLDVITLGLEPIATGVSCTQARTVLYKMQFVTIAPIYKRPTQGSAHILVVFMVFLSITLIHDEVASVLTSSSRAAIWTWRAWYSRITFSLLHTTAWSWEQRWQTKGR